MSTPRRTLDTDLEWYVEQEKKIQECTAESRRLRTEMRKLFDPGCLYVVEFDSGVVKVGKTASAEGRLEAHAKAGLVRSSWASPYHLYCGKAERKLIAFCNEHGTLHGGREYFRDIAFTVACDYAERIVFGHRCRIYLDDLTDAVNGDLSKTVAEAQVAFDRIVEDDLAA
jgi:hypothetical protein